MKKYFDELIKGNNLTREQSYHLFSILRSQSIEQQSAVLALCSAKKLTCEELLGYRECIYEHSIPIKTNHTVIDIVGTGGEGIGTFNISTAASLVIGSCGVSVAKHGGRSVSSQSGSTDVIECLGLVPCGSAEDVIDHLEKYHYAYLPAPVFNPFMKYFRKLRQSLGFPTIFNVLGPLLNPMKPKRQVIGVYRKDLMLPVINVLKQSGSEHALVVHSEDGLDEFSISASTHVAELFKGVIKEYILSPADVGLPIASLQDVLGGSAIENAVMISDILFGKLAGPKLDIVLLNSAAGLLVAERVSTMKEGIEMARQAITSGITGEFMNRLSMKEVSHE